MEWFSVEVGSQTMMATMMGRGRTAAGLGLLLALGGCKGDDQGTGASTGASTGTTSPASTGTASEGSTASGSSSGGSSSSSGTGVASASTSGSTSTSTTGETGCMFVDCTTTDGCPGVCGGCDLWNDDCPDGQKCSAWANDGGGSWNATKCVPVEPMPGKPGEPCTVEGNAASGIDSCEAGAMCWWVDPQTLTGTCVGLCDGSPEEPTCAEAGTFCSVSNDGVLILCLPSCDPLAPDACAEGELCTPIDGGYTCLPDASPGSGGYGADCSQIAQCAPGLFCALPGVLPECPHPGCCTPFCALDEAYTAIPAPAAGCPEPALGCLNLYMPGEAPPGYEEVGICALVP